MPVYAQGMCCDMKCMSWPHSVLALKAQCQSSTSNASTICYGVLRALACASGCLTLHDVVQVVALLYYTVSYFPGGTNGVKFVMKMAFGAFMNCCRGMQRAVTG